MKSKTVYSKILVGYVSSTPSLKVFCAQWELKSAGIYEWSTSCYMGTQTRYILLSLDRLYVVAVLNKPIVMKIGSDFI